MKRPVFKIPILIVSGFLLLIFSCRERKEDHDRFDGASLISEGEELVKMHCMTCHSLKYIEMQPAFPRKTWEKITGKMIKNFGAPIPDSAAKKIVDYLVSVKGTEK